VKACEEITTHQLDELRLVFRCDLKSGGPLNVRAVTIGSREHSECGAMVANRDRRVDKCVRIGALRVPKARPKLRETRLRPSGSQRERIRRRLDLTNGNQSAAASNRRLVAQTFAARAPATLLTKPVALLRRDRARCAFEFFQNHALGEQFREDNWLFRFSRIKHVEWDAGSAKLLQ
jgi:hypothetical protein